jgi:DNA-binding Xre family transcriptional regulator
MSHFAVALEQLLKENQMTAAGLSRASGLTEAGISRLKSGLQTWVNARDLEKIAQSFTASKGEPLPKIHARLLLARLQDECFGPGAGLVTIALASDPKPPALNGNASAATPVLPPKLQQHLDVISAHIAENRHVRDLVESIANLCLDRSPNRS